MHEYFPEQNLEKANKLPQNKLILVHTKYNWMSKVPKVLSIRVVSIAEELNKIK